VRQHHDKYLPAQRAYLATHRPREYEDVIIDIIDWSAPHCVKRPAAPTRVRPDG
jgi:hypothetical protein